MSTTVFPESGDQITEAAWTDLNEAMTVAERYRLNGYTLSAGTGLNADVAAGTCMVNGYYINSDATQAVSVTASQTNYIWLNEDGTLSANTTGTNPGDELLLGTAVTDGSGVTSVSHDYNIKNSQYVYIRKSADEAVSGSTTLQNDDDFTFDSPAGANWEVDIFMSVTFSNSTGDMKMDLTGTGPIFFQGQKGATGLSSDSNVSGTVSWDANSGTYVGYLKAYIYTSSASAVTLRWAQNTASGTTTLKQDSIMVARRILG